MASLILYYTGNFEINFTERLSNYRNHHSYSGEFFKINFSKELMGLFSESNMELLKEYCSVLVHTIVFGTLLYFILSSLSYIYFFIWKKTKFLPKLNGNFIIMTDIKWSLINILFESLLVTILRMAIPRYSFIYYNINDYGYMYLILSIVIHMLFDETLTYWVHRVLHTNNFLYRHFHRIHHLSIDVTPFSGFAFHPLDAFAQAVPTFTSCFFFPLHMNVLLLFSFFTTVWAISIHDNVPALPIKIFLYATHHTIHHEKGIGMFRNYGKFTAFWDRLAGTYSDPDRLDYGWIRSKSTVEFFNKLNEFIDKYIPDKTEKERNNKKKE